jgi:hypothetical protein
VFNRKLDYYRSRWNSRYCIQLWPLLFLKFLQLEITSLPVADPYLVPPTAYKCTGIAGTCTVLRDLGTWLNECHASRALLTCEHEAGRNRDNDLFGSSSNFNYGTLRGASMSASAYVTGIAFLFLNNCSRASVEKHLISPCSTPRYG